jgi:hypothetical protein
MFKTNTTDNVIFMYSLIILERLLSSVLLHLHFKFLTTNYMAWTIWKAGNRLKKHKDRTYLVIKYEFLFKQLSLVCMKYWNLSSYSEISISILYIKKKSLNNVWEQFYIQHDKKTVTMLNCKNLTNINLIWTKISSRYLINSVKEFWRYKMTQHENQLP